jgi:serine/threonine-protein kinase
VLGERYEIRAVIGHGGMGEVFLSRDRKLDNDVAIKRLNPQFASSQEMRESLRREAQIMARLSDASIVRLFDLAEFYGDFYLILEYVPGPTLREMIRAGYRATPQELARIMGEICQGLTVAHNAGVIHRDLKPSNILVALQGAEQSAFKASRRLPANLSGANVKITDFGIAKAIAAAHLTVTNAFSGTPGYMAPEQFRGEIPWPQTDVYALGVVTCELLTGKLPTQPVQMIEGVHPAVTDVVRKALSLAASSRFPSAAKFYEALYSAIEGRSPFAHVPVPAQPAVAPAKIAALCAVVVFMFAAIAAVLINQASPRVHPPLATIPEMPSAPAPRPAKLFPDPPPPIEWRSFPKASELPPVVEEARGRVASSGLLGPQRPKVKWDLTLPEILSAKIAFIGTDGTVYLTGFMGEMCAIHEGKLLWAYKSSDFAASFEDLAMDRDGRIWFRIHTMGGYERYCINRDGKGGRLPASFENQGPTPVTKTFLNSYSCWKNKHTLSGPQGDLDLDNDCLGVAVSPEEKIYVATDAPEILTVSKQGRVEFKYKAPCQPSRLVPILTNQLVFACADHSLHALKGAAEAWNRTMDGDFRNATADAAGALYFGDDKGLRAIDSQGKDLWSIDLHSATDGEIAFGNDRQMYIFQSIHDLSRADHVISLTDQ